MSYSKMLNQLNSAAYLRPGKLGVLFVFIVLSSQNIFALGETNYVATRFTPNSFALCDGQAATILIDTNDWPGVVRAADDLVTDLHRVTHHRSQVFNETKSTGKNESP